MDEKIEAEIEAQLAEDIEIWKPAVNDQVIGEFVETRPEQGRYQNNLHILARGGQKIGIWGCAVIDDKLKDAKQGDAFGIRYLGDAEGPNGRYKNYKVIAYQ
jgi:hypothetical protein